MPRHPPNALFTLESNHPCAGTSPPHKDTQIVTRGKFTLPAPPENQTVIPTNRRHWVLPTASPRPTPVQGAGAKPTEVKNLFTISKNKAGSPISRRLELLLKRESPVG